MGRLGAKRQNQKEAWKCLCHEIQGEARTELIEGGLWKATKVVAHYGAWTITLDTYTVSTGHTHQIFTRMRAPFANPGGLRFTIYRKSIFSGLGKLLGMQDIEIGDPEFDDAFIIKGNDEFRVRDLFSNPKMRDLFRAQPKIRLEVKDDEGMFGTRFPEGVDELLFHVSGVIKDVERLKSLFRLFSETLEQLCRIGSANTGDPGVSI
jgi:hypothetical protein